jgi:uncharacterized protein (DUF58 family)
MSKTRKRHPIYILPTADGLKVMALNLILLIMGLIYANNYVLLFNFVLFCLFLGSMVYSHFNLRGISIASVSISDLHPKETALMKLVFKTNSAQGHYFIKAYFQSSHLNLIDTEKAFAISASENNIINLRVEGVRRGVETIESLYIETQFPFNFFRCFTFLRLDLECFVYPEKNNLKVHQVKNIDVFENNEADGYFLRDYRVGDSLKRVDWKKVAKDNRWYTKEVNGPSPVSVLIDIEDDILRASTEDSLQSICYDLYHHHHSEVLYGLRIGTYCFIAPDNSRQHLEKCLKELSRYAN